MDEYIAIIEKYNLWVAYTNWKGDSSASKIVLHYDDTSMGNFQKKRATTLSCNPFLAV